MLKERVLSEEDLQHLKETKKPRTTAIFSGEISSYPGFVLCLVQLVIRLLSRVVLRTLASVKVVGRENLKHLHGPLLVVANHKSYFDPVVIAYGIPILARFYPLRFIAKDQFFVKPLSRFFFQLLGTYPSYYGQGLDRSLKTPIEILKNGGSAVFFPEGKCIRQEGLGTPKIGAALLLKAVPGITVLPLAIKGSFCIKDPFHRVDIKIIFGKPFQPSNEAVSGNTEDLLAVLMTKISQAYYSI